MIQCLSRVKTCRFLKPEPTLLYLRVGLAAVLALPPLTSAKPVSSLDDFLDMELDQLLQTRITGSHISANNNSATGPITLIDQDAIARSGATSLEQLLQQLPISAGYAGNQSNAYWAVNGYGNTHVNLRGLGINRTLVLLDGHRIANGGTGANAAPDLNAIPLSMVERIEIFRDGASAIYGADAVAGVVNIITRRRLEGGKAKIHYGQTSQGDGAEQAAELSWGTHSEAGSLLLNLSHFNSDPINMASRAPCALGELGGELVCVDSGNTIGGRALLADGQRVNFNQIPGGDGDFYEPYARLKHNFNTNPYLNAVNPIERTSLSAKGERKLTEQVSLTASLIYTRRESEQLPSPGTIGTNRPITIAANHPTNPTGQALILQGRRLLEAGGRGFYQDVDYYSGQLGLAGQSGPDWDWQTSINWSRNSGVDGWTNVANLNKVEASLDRFRCSSAPNASVPCADYLGFGDLTPEVIDYLMLDTRDRGGNQQLGYSANLSGELLQLATGPLMLATGVELHRDKAWRDPDPVAISGEANINQQNPIDGELAAREAFLEANIPLLKSLPLIESLYLSSALRYSDYDQFGDSTNYKLGLHWQLLPSLQLRTNYATAFRTPNIPELFSTEQTLFLVTSDPCSNWSSQPTDSAIYQNCQAAGVPLNYQQLVSTIRTSVGGNAELEPEEAHTHTLGVQWQPASFPSLTLTLDYYSIEMEQAIVNIDGHTRLDACYKSTALSHPFCGVEHFTRNPQSGEINYLSSTLINAAQEQQDGVDLSLFSDFSFSSWRGRLDWESSYLRSYRIQLYETAPFTEYAGKVTSGRGSYLRWRSLARFSLARGDWSGSYSWHYLDEGTNQGAAKEAKGAQQASVSYHHLQLGYQLTQSLQLSFGIHNLFDRKTPYVANWIDGNTDTMTYDLAGRRWYLALGMNW